MSRRSSTHGVTLFPFLDVLVSAMGSLILLLLITSQHTPKQLDAINPLAVPVATTEDPDDAQKLARAAALEQRQKEIDSLMASHQAAIAQHEQETAAAHARWQANLAAMEAKNQEMANQAAGLRQSVEEQAAEAARGDAQRQKLAEMVAIAEQRNSAHRQSEAELQKVAVELLEKRKSLQANLEAQKVAMAIRKPVFQVIAHDGNSGTDRHPILIECRSDGLTFASEQVQVTARDLNDFPPEHNPLLAGAQALMTYWTLADAQKGEKNSRPYVLLIVRPSGTVGFYVARKYLETLNQEYGYELVPEGTEIKWPTADPQAVKVCRTAVERARQESRVYSGMTGGGRGNGGGRGSAGYDASGARRGATGDQIVGANGEFHLPEVEEMRNSSPKDSIDMLGPAWSRQKKGANGATSSEPAPTGSAFDSSDPTLANGRGVPGSAQSSNAGNISEQQSATAANSAVKNATGNGIASSAGANQSQSSGIDMTDDVTAQGTNTSQRDRSNSRRSIYDKPPDMPNSPLVERDSSNMPRDGGKERQWGRPGRSGAIGIEREIILQMYSDRLTIVDGPTVSLPPDIGRGEFHELVAAMIQTQATNWGEPPQKFIWRPRLKIEIYPGGNQHYARLKELLNHWGISSKIEHKLN